MLPRVDPVRPVRSPIVPVGREWTYELKLDGFRGVLSIDGKRAGFTSKTGKPLGRFADLALALAQSLGVKSAILDGEVIVMSNGGPDFNALFFRRGAPSYAAFDLLWLDGRDLRQQPLWRRKRALQSLLKGSPVAFVEPVDDPGLFTATCELDLEGIVAKRRGDPYAANTTWIKVKHRGYSQVQGRWELFDRRR